MTARESDRGLMRDRRAGQRKEGDIVNRDEDRLGANIRQAGKINGVLLVVVLIVALLIGWNWPTPAQGAAKRDATIIVDNTWAPKRWPAAKSVLKLRAQGVPVKLGRCWDIEPKDAPRCITLTEVSNLSGKKLGETTSWGAIWGKGTLTADVQLSKKDGKRASKSKRERQLRKYIRQAAGR